MSTPVLDKAVGLYEKGGKLLRILSDEKFNILWNSSDYDTMQITFSDIDGKRPADGMICSVYVNGHCRSAECTVINIDGEKLYMWTVRNAADIIFHLGYTNTYKQVSYLIKEAKENIATLMGFAEQMVDNKDTDLTQLAKEQNHICFELLQQTEVLDRLTEVIYGQAEKERTVRLYKETADVIAACNRFINKYNRNIRLFAAQPDTINDIIITGEKQILVTALFCIIKRAISSSFEQNYMLSISHDNNNVYLYLKYLVYEKPQRRLNSDEFDYFAAEMYIEYIGGKINLSANEKSEEIEIVFPIYRKEHIFKSDTSIADEPELDRLAVIFLNSII
ncbi:MAG: hypothetical protein J1E39_01185 [Eubacterium sp.]|nr:hypothetical protein [Eubacterium sp.]